MTGPTYTTREQLRGLRPEQLVAALREGRIDEAAIREAYAAERAAAKQARLARRGLAVPPSSTTEQGDAPTT
ncbi:hypothetical protein DQE82_29600 [Micromonospora sp. LHW51205]|uniref:hypothetical protein n=1 Tax=Micromonospora sp. LHW51205 TaxID=2248752 RepID=UPI000DE91750|nr:hypothetical protein [Micromonospora sp. LHW51205]RBQ03892.1 hypothetical protein DQE82_29600 [Micromonospora sp. LHW51205]